MKIIAQKFGGFKTITYLCIVNLKQYKTWKQLKNKL
jgi:hypothetical protein